MVLLFVILVILASAILSLIVLVQNPKGGGLAGNIAGFSNQFMGVKQTTDVLEKGTWIFAIVVALLCISSTVFIPGSHTRQVDTQQQSRPVPQGTGTQAPASPAGTTR
jgi:preprotein translocase subunit SecG